MSGSNDSNCHIPKTNKRKGKTRPLREEAKTRLKWNRASTVIKTLVRSLPPYKQQRRVEWQKRYQCRRKGALWRGRIPLGDKNYRLVSNNVITNPFLLYLLRSIRRTNVWIFLMFPLRPLKVYKRIVRAPPLYATGHYISWYDFGGRLSTDGDVSDQEGHRRRTRLTHGTEPGDEERPGDNRPRITE